jgi:phenylacetate-CoA ligase
MEFMRRKPTFRQYLANKAGYPLQDIWTKTEIIKSLVFLRESQYWDEMRMEEYRSGRLRMLLKHAYNNVPYYKQTFDRIKLRPEDIRGTEDLYKIPVVTRDIFRSRNAEFVASGSSLKHVRTGKTGGTTGSPVTVYKDTTDRSMTWASYYRWYEWMGIAMGEKTVTFWGAGSVTENNYTENLRQSIINYLQNAYVFNSFRISREHLPEVISKINRMKPVLIKGYLSSLLFLAGYMNENDIELPVHLKAVSSTTETLLQKDRKMLESTFHVPVYDQYGCGEASAIAYECACHRGMHLTQEHVIVEILDENENPVVGSGNVVLTNLDNFIMPFIRYVNGDMATLASGKCTCGVTSPLIASVDGRVCDTIILKDGARVHGVFFTDILFEKKISAEKIIRFQVYQDKPGEIEFRIESPLIVDKQTDNLLTEVLGKYFSRVMIKRSEKLENEVNGKFRYIKSEVS